MSDADLDLEALFDEISAGTQAASAAASPAPAPAVAATAAEPSEASVTVTESAESVEDQSDKPMYARLGGIVRMLHDSMRELGYDRSLQEVASQIGDAQGRLEFVATLTEQAANKVLNAIDIGMPAQDVLSGKAKNIGSRWDQLFTGKLSIEEFKTLAGDSRAFATTVIDSAETEKGRMLEIMMAQDFQDITGQLIKKIVGITAVAERELAQLLRDNAPPELLSNVEQKEKPTELMSGPAADGSALVQNDVDDLLDSLGF
ncbi:MAG: chemotaxis protein CheZ [Herbaspirillum sp.]|nr:chemotaxis protein CheZ [Herbaspirillum sp.]